MNIKMYPDFLNMTGDELESHFDTRPKVEILETLEYLKLTPHSNLNRRKLIHYAVRQIIETGRFIRIAKGLT